MRATDDDPQFSSFGCLFSVSWTLLTLPIWIVAFVLLATGITTEGRLFALAVACLLPVPLNLLHLHSMRRKVVTALLLVVGTGALLLCANRAPAHRDDPDAAARLVYQSGDSHARYSPANLVPEIDQHILGSYLFALIDPSLSWDQAADLRTDLKRIYREVANDPDLAPLPSVLGSAYREMLGLNPRTGRLFVYLPEGNQPKPAILFLHGSLGNFQGSWQIWKSFADENGIAIVAPSFGAGNWYKDGGLEAIEQARLFCEEHPMIDSKRIVLAGLSNGGLGVTRGARATPNAWRGLIFLSPVFEKMVVDSEEFANGWAGRSVLIITGEEDKRTTPTRIREVEELLTGLTMKVESHHLPDEDHFLAYSDWPKVSRLMIEWLRNEGHLSEGDP